MPRGRPRVVTNVSALEQELAQLRERESHLKQQIRRLKNSGTEVRKLETKLEKQLSTAKWTVGQIKELQGDWDEVGFYHSVQPKAPTPRGRRKKTATPAG